VRLGAVAALVGALDGDAAAQKASAAALGHLLVGDSRVEALQVRSLPNLLPSRSNRACALVSECFVAGRPKSWVLHLNQWRHNTRLSPFTSPSSA
jgi:hypothetical protein